MKFNELNLIDPILKAIEEEGYTHPTPIQEQSIPILLNRKDLLGCAQTGTGKTAAFSIPIIQHLETDQTESKGKKKIKALIVTPTRELAIQIGESIKTYGKYTKIRSTVIFGGVKQGSQTRALSAGVDILVASPGRLLDLIQQKYISLSNIEYFVLDEADRMLDMGFIHDIKKIIAKLPTKRQSLFFSATMPKSIVQLSKSILGDYEKVAVKPEQATAEKVGQSVYFVSKKGKRKLLIHLLQESDHKSVLVFSRTKHGADKIVRLLSKADIKGAAIHGNKSQNARQKALQSFKEGKLNVLVATDIAARGIDVEELALVINYDLPNVPETYVHRIGRTGRAKASGDAISFCSEDEKVDLKSIQKLINQEIPVVEDHPYVDFEPDEPSEGKKKPQQRNKNKRNSGQNNSNRNKNTEGSKNKKFGAKRR